MHPILSQLVGWTCYGYSILVDEILIGFKFSGPNNLK